MIIYGSRNIQSEEYKISKLDYMSGKELWTIAKINVPEVVDFDKNIWEDDWKTYYIKIIDKRKDRFLGHIYYRIAFFYYNDITKGVYSLYDADKLNNMLIGTDNVFNNIRLDSIECDFKEIILTEELYDIIMHTRYDWRARLED